MNYGSAGAGGLSHLGTELLAATAKVQLTHVPYKGMAPAFNDLLGGHVQMLLPSMASVAPQLRGGTMRGLATTGAQRSPLAPDLPTVAEAGLPGFTLEVWWGLLGPSRMPAGVVKRLQDELAAVLALPEVRDILAREGSSPRPGTPDDLRQLITMEYTRWTRLIKEADIQTE